eukprot:43335-Pyramimonas_sp.AAC.1
MAEPNARITTHTVRKAIVRGRRPRTSTANLSEPPPAPHQSDDSDIDDIEPHCPGGAISDRPHSGHIEPQSEPPPAPPSDVFNDIELIDELFSTTVRRELEKCLSDLRCVLGRLSKIADHVI